MVDRRHGMPTSSTGICGARSSCNVRDEMHAVRPCAYSTGPLSGPAQGACRVPAGAATQHSAPAPDPAHPLSRLPTQAAYGNQYVDRAPDSKYQETFPEAHGTMMAGILAAVRAEHVLWHLHSSKAQQRATVALCALPDTSLLPLCGMPAMHVLSAVLEAWTAASGQ